MDGQAQALDGVARRPRRPRRPRWRATPVAVSLAAHLLAAAAVVGWQAGERPPPAEPPSPVVLALVRPTEPPPPPKPPAPAKASAPKPSAKPAAAPPHPRPRPTPPPPPQVAVLPIAPGPSVDAPAEISDAELAGALTAEGGGTGSGVGGAGQGAGAGGCNMVRRLQAALRRDPEVRAAVARAHAAGAGRALLVWDGDWIRSTGQDGKGLAGLRQAIALEVAFAPEACRADPVHGRVLISMGDGPGAPRLVLGRGVWRWSQLLGLTARGG